MEAQPQPVFSWGRTVRSESFVVPHAWRTDPLPHRPRGRMLPLGLARSYGDSCLNHGGTLIDTRWLRHFIAFDPARGVLRAEAGVTLGEILEFAVPRGWFLPTTPGTKFVTLGGAIANDVHGKNHHRAGTLGNHLHAFELLRSDGTRLECGREKNAEWFAATIGGLGLTGLITWAEIQLRPIQSSFIDVETTRFASLEEFFAIASEADRRFEHTVSWIDALATGPALGRGLFMGGNHCADAARGLAPHRAGRLIVPLDAPNFALNPLTVRAFNTAYFRKQWHRKKQATVHYDPFFYPLDAIARWNRIYGRRGFFQYQSVVPMAAARETLTAMLRAIAASAQASFLSVLKEFGTIPSPGILSFPRPGMTLALDFPNAGAKTLELLHRLDRIVAEAGGRLYPAKDGRMTAEAFAQSYPEWQRFAPFADPQFSSDFIRRVIGDPAP